MSAVTNENNDIWVVDLQAGTNTRQTFDAGQDETPVWSPDGVWLAYGSTRGNSRMIFRRRSDGSGRDEVLWQAPLPIHAHVQDWLSNTGAIVIAMAQNEAPTKVAVLAGGSAPTAILEGAIDGRVSPDARWIAYVSTESGRQEVYIQSFRSRGGKWQISTDGGTEPVWSKTGDELFYRGSGAVNAVRISSSVGFSAGPPQRLFADSFVPGGLGHTNYDVAGDSQRFLMISQNNASIVVV
jgi:serine/threonine-protein kinase